MQPPVVPNIAGRIVDLRGLGECAHVCGCSCVRWRQGRARALADGVRGLEGMIGGMGSQLRN
jgi:hypothetical protein